MRKRIPEASALCDEKDTTEFYLVEVSKAVLGRSGALGHTKIWSPSFGVPMRMEALGTGPVCPYGRDGYGCQT
ncbi:hypothetical protein EVAR_82652_1 [Eumeta japonica]|uniref:Uncharacterized protein n=1 Tax=Eumeta variegata TaxID=151549 RepID=A0A4C1V9V8_EUMVA|nr:hypothetical protein EVAR_82652_1 [Eumeta japonica]